MIANLKLVLEVEVQPGNQANSKYSLPGLMSLLERFPKMCWPAFVRGDCDWGTDRVMTELEQAGCHYLFKIKKTANVNKAIYHAHCNGGWTFQGNSITSTLVLVILCHNSCSITAVRFRFPHNHVRLWSTWA